MLSLKIFPRVKGNQDGSAVKVRVKLIRPAIMKIIMRRAEAFAHKYLSKEQKVKMCSGLMVQMSAHTKQTILGGLTVFLTRYSTVQPFTVAAVTQTEGKHKAFSCRIGHVLFVTRPQNLNNTTGHLSVTNKTNTMKVF